MGGVCGRCPPKPCTQGIANWVVNWSFGSLGEDGVEEANHMHYKNGNQLS